MHQQGEMAFDHLLQFRLYVGTVQVNSRNQACWSLDNEKITY